MLTTSLFFLLLSSVPLYECTLCISIHRLQTSWSLPDFGSYEQRFSKHTHTDCGMNTHPTSQGSLSVPRRSSPPSPAVSLLTLHHELRGRAELAGFARELGLVVRRTRDQHQLSGEDAPRLLHTSQLYPPWFLGRPRFGHGARVLRAETDWGTTGSPAIPASRNVPIRWAASSPDN